MRSDERVYLSGDDYFSALLEAIDQAQSEILLESYIFEDGLLGKKILDHLKAASQRKVVVKIMVDAAGSYDFIPELSFFCSDNSIQLKVYHPIIWSDLINTFKFLNRRNHRKSCILDDSIAFTGSLNISDVHISIPENPLGWKDYGVSFQGQGVADLKKAFLKIFQKEALKSKIKKTLLEPDRNNSESGLYLNDSHLKRRECYQNLINRIQKAQSKIWIANAYILPEFKIQSQLEKAAQRGVDVRLLTSGKKSDIFFMPWLTRLSYKKALKSGIKLFEYAPSVFHGKVLSVDDYLSIGSSNLNHRSVFHDLEVDIVIVDNNNKMKVLQDLEICFSNSNIVNAQKLLQIPFWQRLIARALYLFKYWF